MKGKISVFIFVVFDIFLFLWLILHGSNIELLNPKGIIATAERNLLFTELSLMLLVGIPVILFIFYTAFRFREENTKEEYDPESKHKILPEFLWWGLPAALVLLFAFMTWNATHALDPYKAIQSDIPPVKIQVVALRWKWLFIYPEQNIATVNFIEFPVSTPVNFELTADAPMNSFWIPQLSGQIYAMSGMSTKLHIQADEVGDYNGSAAEISGAGFAGMRFTARAVSQEDFDSWVETVKNSGKNLDEPQYMKLVKPSENNPPLYYALGKKDLYNFIINKYMGPASLKGMDLHMEESMHND